jgi:branched-chain amino acid transport system permease protein
MESFLRSIMLGLACGGIYALVAVSYVIIYKATRIFAFSQAGMLVIGSYTLWQCLVVWSLPVWLSILISLAIGAAIALIIERACMRPLIGQPILAPIVVTLGIMLFFRGIALLFWHGECEGYGASFLPLGAWKIGFMIIPKTQAYGFVICMISIALLISFYKYTRMGLGMRVVHEDHLVAQNLGINVKRIFQYSWIFSCWVAVIGGMLLGNIQGVGLDLDANGLVAIAAVLFGGLESFGGAVIAGLSIGVIQIFAIQYLGALLPGEITMLVPFVFLLLILFIKPYGLFGLVRIERL